MGQFDRGLSGSDFLVPVEGSAGPIHAPSAKRRHLLDVEAVVLQGSLRVDWTYSANFHETATVERLAAGFLDALRSLVAHCRSAAETEFTPSDFPLAALKQDRLDRILRKFGKE
ncbi:MAG: hypothetical protein LC796_09915 [Acidobacteria bacterium]|nr:hypothetical protein [Acidobacteriota bacterium]